MLTCYPSPGKRKGLRLARAFAEGCGGRVAKVGETQLAPGPAFFYGMTGHSLPLIEQCRREGRDWYYADNAYYFGRGAYFRVTKNAYQHAGQWEDPQESKPRAGRERLARFGITVKPWRAQGRPIVITTQSDLFYRFCLGIGRDAWLAETMARIKAVSGRPVEVCHKPAPGAPGNPAAGAGFEKALRDAHALVTHSSSTAVKALIEGVPVFCTGACVASPLGLNDLAAIETPLRLKGRKPWLRILAANQWTRLEMRNGICWRMLHGLG